MVIASQLFGNGDPNIFEFEKMFIFALLGGVKQLQIPLVLHGFDLDGQVAVVECSTHFASCARM